MQFQAKFGSLTPFYFEVKEPCIIRVETWPLDDESEPELYMSVDKSKVTNTVYTWKSQYGGSMHIDSQEIEVFPGEPEFK